MRAAAWTAVLLFAWGHARAQGNFNVQDGSTVSIHYALTVEGRIVDQSKGRGPLRYVQGAGQIIPGLEEELRKAKVGDKKRVVVQAGKGYGQVNPDLYQTVPKKSFKDRSKLKPGSVVTGQFNGGPVHATIVGMDDKSFFLDLNHPLAGKTLQFDVEVVDIQAAKPK